MITVQYASCRSKIGNNFLTVYILSLTLCENSDYKPNVKLPKVLYYLNYQKPEKKLYYLEENSILKTYFKIFTKISGFSTVDVFIIPVKSEVDIFYKYLSTTRH